MFHFHNDDSCPQCQDAPDWARHLITRLETIMSQVDQDALNAFVSELTPLVAQLAAAATPVPPVPLDLAAANALLAQAQADVAALTPAPPVA